MKFSAIEYALPTKAVTNSDVLEKIRAQSAKHLSPQELETLLEMTETCFQSTKTRIRYHRGENEHACLLGVEAGKKALMASGLRPEDIDLLIYVGIGKGMIEPASANIFLDLLGFKNATGFDVLDACASWLRALHLAQLFLSTGTHKRIMILNAECVGRDCHRYELKSLAEFAHWHPSVTIGEAASATILEASESDQMHFDFRTWGDKRDLCFVPLPNFEGYFGKAVDPALDWKPLQFFSYGIRLMEFGAEKMIEHYRSKPEFSEYVPDLVFGHAASDGMSEYVVERCGIPKEKFQFTHHLFANTISASVPVAMSAAMKSGKLRDNVKILILFASAGVTTALARFQFQSK